MKKTVLLSFLCIFTFYGYSQFIVFGAKAGLNMTSFTSSFVEDTKFRPSFHAGGFANFLLNDQFMLQPEVLYSGKGSKFKDGNYVFSYINVPVLVQYQTESGFFVEAGPQIGFKLGATRKEDGLSDFDLDYTMKPTDFSWVFGLGYKTSSGFGGGARYDFGYYNVVKAGTIKNKTILISLFYTFGSLGD